MTKYILVSLLTNNPIRPDLAITGEMNLSGEVMEIGGLREKLYGAKSAGCALVLFPADNQKHLDKICRECSDLFDSTFAAKAVSTIFEVLEIALQTKGDVVTPPSSRNESEDIQPIQQAFPTKCTRRSSRRM